MLITLLPALIMYQIHPMEEKISLLMRFIGYIHFPLDIHLLQGLVILPDLPLVKEFRQPTQVQSHLAMPGILVQLGHIQRTKKLAPQIDPKRSPTWSLRRCQAICP